MRAYFDPAMTWAELEEPNGGAIRNAARFDARKTRGTPPATERFDPERLRRCAMRAFDTHAITWPCGRCGTSPVPATGNSAGTGTPSS
jgi:hypothetical protein